MTITQPAVRPDRCPLTARFAVEDKPFIAQCVDAEGHPGDCTVIDPNIDKAVTVGLPVDEGVDPH